MKFITIRDFRNNSAKIQRELFEEKEMVLTSNGKPIAILIPTSASSVDKSLAVIRQAKAMEAVNIMQSKSIEAGTDRLGLKEINKEIAEARKERKGK